MLEPNRGPSNFSGESKPKIRTLAKLGESNEDEASWRRHAPVTGQGATHVKSFHCKLQGDALTHLDTQINNWIESHEDCEIKLVTTQVGEWSDTLGKAQHLIVQIWV
ncbi:MAG: hypothetical protein KIT54_05425 [Phycisphaeraceae bacterium]|nr:hypothetical protein [Phycisphaeraceae bacterium]